MKVGLHEQYNVNVTSSKRILTSIVANFNSIANCECLTFKKETVTSKLDEMY